VNESCNSVIISYNPQKSNELEDICFLSCHLHVFESRR